MGREGSTWIFVQSPRSSCSYATAPIRRWTASNPVSARVQLGAVSETLCAVVGESRSLMSEMHVSELAMLGKSC